MVDNKRLAIDFLFVPLSSISTLASGLGGTDTLTDLKSINTWLLMQRALQK